MEISLRAFNLLIEEYPLSEKYCHKLPNEHFRFATDVAKFEGAARFVLGLSEDITVKGSPEFIDFLKEKSKNMQNKFLTPRN